MVPVILDLNNINLKFLPHKSWETLLIWLTQFVRTKLGRFASYYRDLSVIQNGLFFSCSVLIYHLSLTPRLWHPIKCPNVISFFNSSKCRVNFVSRQRWELRRKRYFCILRHFAAAVQRTAPPAYFFSLSEERKKKLKVEAWVVVVVKSTKEKKYWILSRTQS